MQDGLPMCAIPPRQISNRDPGHRSQIRFKSFRYGYDPFAVEIYKGFLQTVNSTFLATDSDVLKL